MNRVLDADEDDSLRQHACVWQRRRAIPWVTSAARVASFDSPHVTAGLASCCAAGNKEPP